MNKDYNNKDIFKILHSNRFKEVLINEYIERYIFINEIQYLYLKQPNEINININQILKDTILYKNKLYKLEIKGKYKVLSVENNLIILIK